MITILSFKFEVTLFFTLVVIPDGKNCNIWSSVAGNQSSHLSLIIFPLKTGPKGSRGAGETAKTQEKQQGGECTLFSLHFLPIKKARPLWTERCTTRCILSKNTVYKNISLRFGEKIRTPEKQFALYFLCWGVSLLRQKMRFERHSLSLKWAMSLTIERVPPQIDAQGKNSWRIKSYQV